MRKISVNGTIATVAGNGTKGSSEDGGPATSAQFSEIQSLAADGAGNFYVVDASGTKPRSQLAAWNGAVDEYYKNSGRTAPVNATAGVWLS